MPLLIVRLLLSLQFALISNFALATEESSDIFSRFSNYSIEYKINENGSFVERRAWSMQVLKKQVIEDAKSFSFTYSTSIQKADIAEAYTLKADGKKINVPKDNFQITANGGKDSNVAIFSDRTTLTVVFPDVEVGDSLVIDYSVTATEPIFPGHFSETESFYKTYAYDMLKIKVDAPASLNLNLEIRELKEEKNTIQNNRKLIVWSWQNKKPIINRRKDYSVYNYNEDAGFSISTFNTNEEIAKAYGSRATPKAKVTDRIQKLANEISKDKSNQDDIVRSLYDWVATNISYAGNCVGLGAVVPHDLNFILDNRMGDCKDHATLLQALLAAKNVSSTQALVNAGSAYKLPKVPVVSMVNHVINYIPSMNLYLDSTASYIPYRMLPFGSQDKPTLLVENFQPNSKTPTDLIGSNVQELTSYLKINSEGNAEGNTNIKLKGMPAANARSRMREYSADNEKDIIKNNFKYFDAIATGEFTKEDPKELLDTYSYQAKYMVKEMFKLTKTGTINLSPVFYNEFPISGFLNISNIDNEGFDTACSSGSSTEILEYDLPDNIIVLSIPENFKISNDTVSYEASYTLKEKHLSIKRIFDDKTKGNVCSPSVMKKDKELIKKVLENYKEQLIYKKTI